MMRYSVHVVLMLLVAMKTSSVDSVDEEVTSISYKKVEKFTAAHDLVNHMEMDQYLDNGSVLYSSDRVLFTVNNAHTKVVMNLSEAYITGFHQINSTHVALVDTYQHCIRLLNRESEQLEVLAGTCHITGFADGGVGVGKFYGPRIAITDIINPGRLLVIDTVNNALRSVDIQTGELGTVIRSGFTRPMTMAWRHDNLLVVNTHYIAIVRWFQDGKVTNTKLVGSATSGNVDGSFDVARFSFPSDIAEIAEDIYLISELGNKDLRLMNMKSHTIGPVCTQGEISCITSSRLEHQPLSLLKLGEDILVGSNMVINKFSDSNLPTDTACPDNDITALIGQDEETVDVRLHCGNTAVLPLGIHEFKTKNNSDGCSYYVHVINSYPVTRTLVFKAEYKVNCSALEDETTKNVLQSVLEQRSRQLQGICEKNCSMSSTKQPWHDCKDNVLTAYWPTEDLMAGDVAIPPENLNSLLEDRLDQSADMCKEIAIISGKHPMVDAEENADGETIQIAIISSCSDEILTYDLDEDACVEKNR